MKNVLNFLFLLFFSLSLTSCEIIGGIFEAGMWVGLVLVVLVIGVIIWIFRAIFGRR
ncbi:hypothetical protein [Telluribacter sp.]|jgi:hypothetical protein|uniref:hypothetical protein n=1 Tax=Telluribacter sp. TaxID=1978767 RepID=UPI002E0E7DDA|nr:hypothetical protein [Telluribacter sp.]